MEYADSFQRRNSKTNFKISKCRNCLWSTLQHGKGITDYVAPWIHAWRGLTFRAIYTSSSKHLHKEDLCHLWMMTFASPISWGPGIQRQPLLAHLLFPLASRSAWGQHARQPTVDYTKTIVRNNQTCSHRVMYIYAHVLVSSLSRQWTSDGNLGYQLS